MKKTGFFKLVGIGIVIALAGLMIYPKFAFKQDLVDINVVSEFKKNEITGIYKNKSLSVPNVMLEKNFESQVLGETTGNVSNKRIEVDLSNQKLYAYEDGVKKYEFLVSTGTWNRTPTGTFRIWSKIRSQKMSGGSREFGTYYYLPNVPNIMFFYNESYRKTLGFSIHGAYWHNQFGKPMSHGCVNMAIQDSKIIFDWADLNTPIVIYGKMPTVGLPRAMK